MRGKLMTVTLVLAAISAFTVTAYALQYPTDISGHWAETKIKAAIDMKVFDGQPHLLERFEPNQAMTRAEFCAVLNLLYRFTQEKDVTFKDVNDSDWFAADIKRAAAAGYLQGDGNGYAKPNDALTRAEAAVMLNSVEKYPKAAGAAKKFKDYDKIPSWAVDAVDACVKRAVINGDDKGNFRPQDRLTRAEIVALLFNIVGL